MDLKITKKLVNSNKNCMINVIKAKGSPMCYLLKRDITQYIN